MIPVWIIINFSGCLVLHIKMLIVWMKPSIFRHLWFLISNFWCQCYWPFRARLNLSYKFIMLKVSMPCSTVIFKFRQILDSISFIVQVNCNKKCYIQNLPNFKIQGVCVNFWRLKISLFLNSDKFCIEYFLLYVLITTKDIIRVILQKPSIFK